LAWLAEVRAIPTVRSVTEQAHLRVCGRTRWTQKSTWKSGLSVACPKEERGVRHETRTVKQRQRDTQPRSSNQVICGSPRLGEGPARGLP